MFIVGIINALEDGIDEKTYYNSMYWRSNGLNLKESSSFQICPKVDGVRCIQEIAMMVQIDTDLVMRCVRNLHFYGCLTLIPLFMYANTYVATEQLHDFYMNADLIEVSTA